MTIRRLALGALVGGAVLAVANVLLLIDPGARALDSGGDVLVEALVVLGILLTLAGLIGVHLRQKERYGVLGLIGLVLAVVGQAASISDVFVVDRSLQLVTTLPATVGLILLAFAILRAPLLPHWSGFVLLIGFVAFWTLQDVDFGIALDGVAWIVVGYALWSGWAEPAIAMRTQQL
ncbi:MAG TPA: hypothetical protein VGJ58_02140 [Gaiellaceae bacterium]